MSNIVNFYSNAFETFKGFSEYYDLILVSDTKKANTIIGLPYTGQADLFVHIDTNNPQSLTDDKLISLNQWTGATIGDFHLNDIGLTAIDLGFTDQLSGITWTYSASTFSKKMEFNPILTGTSGFNYSIQSDFSGDYIKFEGGWFNGVYKYEGYPYELLPKRYAKGWTTEFLLKLDDLSGYGSSGNTGFFFYLGARAENKFWNIFPGETGKTTTTGIPLSPEQTYTPASEIDYRFIGRFCKEGGSQEVSVVSGNTMSDNIIGFRITPDYRLGFRTMRITGYCDPSSATTISAGNIIDYATKYEKIYELRIDEQYSETPILSGATMESCVDCLNPFSGVSQWVLITVKFSRDITYDTNCRLENGKYKNGTLTFYVNGRPVLNVENFEEIIPDALQDVDPTKQEGVPFNIFLGGGSPGLAYSQTFDGPDPEDEMLPIEQYFNGSFSGGLSQFRMYGKPLDITEIIDNFKKDKCRYNLRGNFGGSFVVLPINC